MENKDDLQKAAAQGMGDVRDAPFLVTPLPAGISLARLIK
jgi:hypothetical protein